MTMLESKARLEASRVQPIAWEFDVKAVKELKKILAEKEDMLGRIELGRAVSGHYDLYLIFRNAKTGVECGEVNTSCPDPPFPLCP